MTGEKRTERDQEILNGFYEMKKNYDEEIYKKYSIFFEMAEDIAVFIHLVSFMDVNNRQIVMEETLQKDRKFFLMVMYSVKLYEGFDNIKKFSLEQFKSFFKQGVYNLAVANKLPQ